MRESDEVEKEKNETDLTKGGVGDVETAGETTAASVITGPVDDRPVGADTLAKVDDTQKPRDRE